ncbi:hypothetical protein [Micromonospora zhanjiangensis]|uniref:Integral membrane protein n=1 Tax=Micromonospora zhanjiangensis TaxID=1522057 RepID=A0ABV8KMK1_9ACTN
MYGLFLLAERSAAEGRPLALVLVFEGLFTVVPLLITVLSLVAARRGRQPVRRPSGHPWTWAAVAATWILTLVVLAVPARPATVVLVMVSQWLTFLAGLLTDSTRRGQQITAQRLP